MITPVLITFAVIVAVAVAGLLSQVCYVTRTGGLAPSLVSPTELDPEPELATLQLTTVQVSPRGNLTANLARQKRANDARFRRNGWLPPLSEEAGDDEPPF